MAELWFWLLALMLATYAVLDGYDFGVGLLHFAIGKTAPERDALLRSIGPVWDGNEVWLIAGGGTLFGAFPVLYATAFSGFYLPLTIVLWLLLFRALGIELRHQLHSPLWHQAWDVAFSVSSGIMALVLGAALGNLVRGLPLDERGEFFEPLWTDFRVGELTGILDWYTTLVGVTATSCLALHGALWSNLKLEGEMQERAQRWASRLWPVVVVLSVVTTAASATVQPQLLRNLSQYPVGAVLPLIALAGLVSARFFLAKRALWSFAGSCAFVSGLVLSAAYAIFPHALPARVAGRELTLEAAASRAQTLEAMLYWWVPGVLLAAAYTVAIHSRMPKTFSVSDSEQH
jgi:cytochrome d ubiquinol oxidase subunit II